MIKEISIADAYGAAFEFVKDPKAAGLINDGITFQKNPKYDLGLGAFTDDTVRTIANARMVLSSVLCSVDPRKYVKYLLQEFKTYYRKGWSKRFQEFLENEPNYVDFFEKLKRTNTNGSVMGVLPLGYYDDAAEVRLAATAQALSTHSWETVPYAQALALMSHFFITDQGKIEQLSEYLLDNVDNLSITKPKPNSMLASDTCMTVLELITKDRERNLKSLMMRVVDLGGDTDTIAALTIGVASCSDEFENNICNLDCEGTRNLEIAELDRCLMEYQGIK